MKFICFILNLYMLFLAILPCSDVEDMGKMTGTEITKQHADSGNSEETCPPFCTCTCCSVSRVLLIISPAAIRAYSNVAPIYVPYITSFPVKISLPVWQPPQIS